MPTAYVTAVTGTEIRVCHEIVVCRPVPRRAGLGGKLSTRVPSFLLPSSSPSAILPPHRLHPVSQRREHCTLPPALPSPSSAGLMLCSASPSPLRCFPTSLLWPAVGGGGLASGWGAERWCADHSHLHRQVQSQTEGNPLHLLTVSLQENTGKLPKIAFQW